jgi:hypothetical protein
MFKQRPVFDNMRLSEHCKHVVPSAVHFSQFSGQIGTQSPSIRLNPVGHSVQIKLLLQALQFGGQRLGLIELQFPF